jgi:predicted  nucleic acid-binding Zn-ribbon protein
MQDLTALERLNTKVSQLLQKCEDLQETNELLRSELMALKAQRELKDVEIERLVEENNKKDREIEEIVTRIESILG